MLRKGAILNNYQLLVDTYGAQTIDEAVLKTDNVSGLIIGLNHIEGGHHLDPAFTTQWNEAGSAGLLRVPYFVYNPAVNGQVNYEWLVKHLPFETGAVLLHIEAGFAGVSAEMYAAEVANFCLAVGARWHYMIYTAQDHLSLLRPWPADADYWWAQYPASLNPPVEQKWTWDQARVQVDALSGAADADKVPGRLKMWQASRDSLILPGSLKPMDLNIFPGTYDELKAWINEKEPLPDPFVGEHTQPYPGVELYKVRRFNSHCFVAVIDPAGKHFLVTPFGLKQVSTVARELGAQLVINGGAYGGYQAYGLHASQGRVYQLVTPYQPWVNLTRDDQPQINAYDSPEKKYNSLAGKRFIVFNGRTSPSTSASWREVHPRTLVGVTRDGKLIECVVDGRQGPNNIGVDLYDAARIMIEFGAWKAIDLDGGGSSTMWVHDHVVNSPIDNGVPGQERYVGTHVAMFVEGVTPPQISGVYTVVRPVRPRRSPSMFELVTKPNLPVGTVFNSSTLDVVTEKIPPVVGREYTITWVKMADEYWVPKFYKVEYTRENIG
jgi:GH25 family lysozyme M1 (1,4-beta-N-acetylmuramidase)